MFNLIKNKLNKFPKTLCTDANSLQNIVDSLLLLITHSATKVSQQFPHDVSPPLISSRALHFTCSLTTLATCVRLAAR